MSLARALLRRLRAWGAGAAVAVLPLGAFAQGTGRIVGTVSDPQGQPLSAAQVSVVGTSLGAASDAQGRFVVRNVPAGTYTVRVTRIGARATTIANVVVSAGRDADVRATLTQVSAQIAGVVVSASRRPEKITEAPATITRIDATAIQNTIGNSFAPALKDVKGLDFIQVGMTAVAVNARGFNSSFNNRMLMMEDNRIAVLPENGLPTGQFTAVNKLDLAGIEVLVGPGAALYGPDASNGVITLQTKDPRQFQGLSLEVAGGNRNFSDAQFRYAGVMGAWGYKVTGEYQQARDWTNALTFAPVVTGGPPVAERGADFNTNVIRGTGALVRYFESGGRLELTAGASQSNGLGQTNVGRNQLVDWQYGHLQAKFSSPRWFAQAYQTASRSGGTFQLNGFSQNAIRFPTISLDSAKRLSDFPARGDIQAAELQNNFDIGMLARTGLNWIDNTRIVYGGQFRRDVVSSDRQWLSDRQSGEDLSITQTGGYFQVESPLERRVKLVLAGRYDKHSRYDAQWSPKAALVVSPWTDNSFRIGYNRAFKSPTLLQTDFFFPNFSPLVGILGNRNGIVVRNAAGVEQARYAPIAPEINTTLEAGYKGILGDRLFVDVSVYDSEYENFISPLVTIANPLAGTFAFDAATNQRFLPGNGPLDPQITLTYLNVGKAKVQGADLGLRYVVSPRIGMSGNVSVISLESINRPLTGILATAGNEATSFNTPTSKATVGMDFTDLPVRQSFGGFTIRYVNGYEFRSGVNVGRVPTFGTFDFSAGYRIPEAGAQVTLQVQNLLACVSGESVPPAFLSGANRATYVSRQRCGMGLRHQEMINAPLLGTMVFFGFRFDR